MAKKPARDGWHKADVIAALHKRGVTLRALSTRNGYRNHNTVAAALSRPYPKAERLIAEALGVPAATIWPSRYHADGSPRSGRGERGLGRHKSKHSSLGGGVGVQATAEV